MRKHCRRRVVVPVPPRGLRPRLSRDQVLDLAIVHAVNLDTLARGEGDETLLWQWVAGALTWSRVAELLGVGVDEMRLQLELATRLVDRYGRTRRVGFSGLDYQLAKEGLQVMDQLAEIVDLHVATAAAEWSEAKVNRMSAACAERIAA
jgi:hypothetical protein